jgi:two-component system NtrC family sensor kinase
MTVRLKLTMGVICAILVANALLMLVAVVYLEQVWLNEVQTRVRLDLNAARAAYEDHIQDIAGFLLASSLDRGLAAAIARGDRQQLTPLLSRLRAAGGMDYVVALDVGGKVLLRTNPAERAQGRIANPLVNQVLKTRHPARGTLVLTASELEAEGPELARQARMELRPTSAARPSDVRVHTEGLVAAACVPVLSDEGKLIGVLYAGSLLNRRNDLVDAIRNVVFPEASDDKQAPPGTVTIFQDDLRVATNVMAASGERAMGTRLSAEVYQEVLVHGSTWAAPAQVLDQWYITAYGPIRDPNERIVGALYVGLNKAPFDAQRRHVVGAVLLAVAAASVASLVLAFTTMNFVLRPVGRVIAMARRVVRGDLSARVKIRPPGEIGVLCQAIDQMADAVVEREQRLKELTGQQIGHSEKLASLGRLAAGVAHEINNPLTGVLTFAHLLREKSNMDDQDRQDLDLIIHETSRAADIVRGLLDFARERAAVKEALYINDVIQKTIRLIRNQKLFDQIVIEEELACDLPQVEGDMNQLQQVLLNLSLNACEAMPNGGRIVIRSNVDGNHVVVKVIDNGTGIRREHYDHVFEPFFTTKPAGKGTGLGLSVSYGIVRQHGGALDFESQEGRGTTFTIVLPALGMEPIAESLAERNTLS